MAGETEVKRKIHFFRADPGINDEGNPRPRIKRFDPTPIVECLFTLDDVEKQLERTDGDLTFCRIFTTDTNLKFQLTTVKMTEAPQRFNRTDSAFLTVELAEEEGIAYSCHMVLFPNNILGVESNYRGPGVGRLEEYFRKKAPIEESKVAFRPLFDREFDEKLRNMREIREVSIRASNLEVEGTDVPSNELQEDDGFKLMREMREVGEVGEYQLTWKAPSGSQESIPEYFIGFARRFLRRVSNQNTGKKDQAAKLIVRGRGGDGHVEVLDVLNDRLMFEERAFKVGPGDRNVIPESAFEAIETAYINNKDKIERAAAFYD